MAYVVKMPKLGLEMEQGTILEWYAEEGNEIDEGDVLLEVESEKSIGRSKPAKMVSFACWWSVRVKSVGRSCNDSRRLTTAFERTGSYRRLGL